MCCYSFSSYALVLSGCQSHYNMNGNISMESTTLNHCANDDKLKTKITVDSLDVCGTRHKSNLSCSVSGDLNIHFSVRQVKKKKKRNRAATNK